MKILTINNNERNSNRISKEVKLISELIKPANLSSKLTKFIMKIKPTPNNNLKCHFLELLC